MSDNIGAPPEAGALEAAVADLTARIAVLEEAAHYHEKVEGRPMIRRLVDKIRARGSDNGDD